MQNPENIIGKAIYVNDGEYYERHVGYILKWTGECYIVGGGSFGNIQPLLDRDQFTIPRKQEDFRIKHKMVTFQETLQKEGYN